MRAFALFFTTSIALVAAQSASQNASAGAIAAMIPACVIPCDDNVITEVGCGLTDYACHCAHGAQLAKLLPACLKANSTCTASDLALFSTLPLKICAALNSTAPTGTGTTVGPLPTGCANTTTNGTCGTLTPGPSSTGLPYPPHNNAASTSGTATGIFVVLAAYMMGMAL